MLKIQKSASLVHLYLSVSHPSPAINPEHPVVNSRLDRLVMGTEVEVAPVSLMLLLPTPAGASLRVSGEPAAGFPLEASSSFPGLMLLRASAGIFTDSLQLSVDEWRPPDWLLAICQGKSIECVLPFTLGEAGEAGDAGDNGFFHM